MSDDLKDTYPYCGGCGHRFFDMPMLTESEANEKSKSLICHYCREDALAAVRQSAESPTQRRE